MVVASTKDARREGGIMPTLSIGNSITVHVYVIIFFRFQFLLNFLLPSRGRRKCRLNRPTSIWFLSFWLHIHRPTSRRAKVVDGFFRNFRKRVGLDTTNSRLDFGEISVWIRIEIRIVHPYPWVLSFTVVKLSQLHRAVLALGIARWRSSLFYILGCIAVLRT